MNYRSYTLFWMWDDKEYHIDFEDKGEAEKKAYELIDKGHTNLYLGHYDLDGKEVGYENYEDLMSYRRFYKQ